MGCSWLQGALALAFVGFVSVVESKSTPPVPTYTWTLKTAAAVTNCPIHPATSTLAQIPATTSSGAKPAFTALVGSDGTVSGQIVAKDSKNNPILFKTTNSSQISLFLASNHRAIIDNHGARLFSNDCRSEFVLPIPNLLSDTRKHASQTKQSKTRHRPKRAESDGSSIPISITYLDQCKNPIKDHSASAQCVAFYDEAGGFKTTTKVPLTLSGNAFVGSCAVPNPTADRQKCKDSIKSILDYPTTGWYGQLTNYGGALGFLSSVIRAGKIRAAIAAAAGLFELPAIELALGALALYDIAIQAHLDTAISEAVCSKIGFITLEVDAALDSQPQQSIAFEGTAPFTGVTATRTVSIPSITCSSSTTTSSSSSSSSTTTKPPTTTASTTNILVNGGFGDYYLNGYNYVTPWIQCVPGNGCQDYHTAYQDQFNSSNYVMELVTNYQVPGDYIYQTAPNPSYNASGSNIGSAPFSLKYRYLPWGSNPGEVWGLAAIVDGSQVATQGFEGYYPQTLPYTTFSTQFNFPRSEPSMTFTLFLSAPVTTEGGQIFIDDVTIAPLATATQIAQREALAMPTPPFT